MPASNNRPQVQTVKAVGGFLVAETADGRKFPVYLYAALLLPRNEAPGDVAFIDDWPDYVEYLAALYLPVPASITPGDNLNKTDFSVQSRANGPRGRTWRQAVYKGYPIYIFGDASINLPNDDSSQDSRLIFYPVPVNPSHRGPVVGEYPIGLSDEEYDFFGPPQSIGP